MGNGPNTNSAARLPTTSPRRAGRPMSSRAPREMSADRAWLGLRTADGVAEADLPAQLASEFVAEGLVERRADRICPTLRGFLLSDRIAARVVQAW